MSLADTTIRNSNQQSATREIALSFSTPKRRMQPTVEVIPADLWQTLHGMLMHPVQSIAPPWSWKAAVFSAALRASSFFAINLRGGKETAVRAMAIEAAYAIFAAGLFGAVSQQLRRTKPLGATLVVVLLGLPALFVLCQGLVHKAAHTPRVAGGLVVSFLLTSLSSAFSWYAMRHGTMLGGTEETSVLHDLKTLPAISMAFVFAAPKAIMHRYKDKGAPNECPF